MSRPHLEVLKVHTQVSMSKQVPTRGQRSGSMGKDGSRQT